MDTLLRSPYVAYALVVDRLRRLPGARWFSALVPWIVAALLVAAAGIVLLWGVQPSPQRMSLADLAAGRLSPMQSWIIVSGELSAAVESSPDEHRYKLTDAAVPQASLDVRSTAELPLGWTTLSGRIRGGREVVPAGYLWSAELRADPRLADELPPPWAPPLLALGALLILVGRRTTYPVFVDEEPREAGLRAGSRQVRVWRDDREPDEREASGTLTVRFDGGTTVTLAVAGGKPIPVRLHSAFTSIGVGTLRTVLRSVPVLRVRAAGENLTIGFASRTDRDVAFAALAAEAQLRTGVTGD